MASNNFYLNSDPLLFSTQPYRSEDSLNNMMAQYQIMQQQMNKQQFVPKDYVDELDRILKSTDQSCLSVLNGNTEYQRLNIELQAMIQNEIMSLIKNKINCNQNAVRNIERQMEILKETNSIVEDEKRRNLNELNDYIKNYSNITFDEYKKKKQQLDNDESK